MKIRCPEQGDIDAIERLEQSALSSWPRTLIALELQQPNSMQFIVSPDNSDKVIGWCCARLLAPEVELLKITVAQDWRRSGIGTALLHHMLERCRSAECKQIFLEVRQNNRSARLFYSKIGFEEQGLRRNYYSDPEDDAIILHKIL